MYLVNEILDFGPGRRQEACDRLAWIHSLMANKPGFQRAIVAKYLGDATRHTVLRIWDDEDAFNAFRSGPDGNYGRGRPEGLYATVPVLPRWLGYDELAGSAQGSYLVKVQTHVAAAEHDLFSQHQAHVKEWMRPMSGLVSLTQWRSPDGDDFLNILRFSSAADFPGIFENADRVKERSAMPEGVAPSDVQCFEVVSEVLPA